MSVITIEGKMDKRILVFPLIRACSIDGPTIVLSDDGNFKNLYQEVGNEGTVSGIDIVVVNTLNSFKLEDKGKDYKHKIYVSSDAVELDEEVDIEISCQCFERSFVSTFNKRDDEEQKKVTIIISSIPIKKKKNVLVLKPDYYRYLIETEEKKELLINKDKQLCKLLANLFHDIFNMKQSQFSKLLTRKKYETSSK